MPSINVRAPAGFTRLATCRARSEQLDLATRRQKTLEQPRAVHGGAPRAVEYLVPAARAVCDDDGIWRATHGRQQLGLGHFHRHPMMRRVVAEAPRHAAARALDELWLCAGNQPQHFEHRIDRAKRALMAVSVQQDGPLRGLEIERETA